MLKKEFEFPKVFTNLDNGNFGNNKNVKYFGIDCVVDIRGTPYSKYNVQFDKETIKYTLTKAGFIYIYMAKEFAAKRINKQSYNEEGYSDFEKVIYEDDLLKELKD